jgi:transposase
VKKAECRIKTVTTDLSAAFIASVMTHTPDLTSVFDHFYLVKLMNDTLYEIRRNVYREEKDLNKRKVVKGTRWLLLRNVKNIFDGEFKSIL